MSSIGQLIQELDDVVQGSTTLSYNFGETSISLFKFDNSVLMAIRYFPVSATFLILYDIILTFSDEVRFIWLYVNSVSSL